MARNCNTASCHLRHLTPVTLTGRDVQMEGVWWPGCVDLGSDSYIIAYPDASACDETCQDAAVVESN